MRASRKIPDRNFILVKDIQELGNTRLGEVHTDNTDDHKIPIINNQIPNLKNQNPKIKRHNQILSNVSLLTTLAFPNA